MVLSWRPKTFQEFTKFISLMHTQSLMAANPQTKATGLGWECAGRLLPSTSRWPLLSLLSPKAYTGIHFTITVKVQSPCPRLCITMAVTIIIAAVWFQKAGPSVQNGWRWVKTLISSFSSVRTPVTWWSHAAPAVSLVHCAVLNTASCCEWALSAATVSRSCPWVGLTRGLGWVEIFSFWWVGLGPL